MEGVTGKKGGGLGGEILASLASQDCLPFARVYFVLLTRDGGEKGEGGTLRTLSRRQKQPPGGKELPQLDRENTVVEREERH